MCAPNRMNDRQTLRIPSWIREFHVYKDWWTPTCGKILPLQPKPENAEDKNAVAVLKESRVIGHIPYHLANTKDRIGIITHFTSKPTNRGSVEVSGKAVNRGGGLWKKFLLACKKFTFFFCCHHCLNLSFSLVSFACH